MKKSIKVLVMIMFVALTVAIAAPVTTQAAVKLNKTKKTMTQKSTYTLKIKGMKSSKIKKVKFTSSNKKVATVKKKSKTKAVVAAKKKGTATITAKITYKKKIKGKKSKKLKFKVTVSNKKRTTTGKNAKNTKVKSGYYINTVRAEDTKVTGHADKECAKVLVLGKKASYDKATGKFTLKLDYPVAHYDHHDDENHTDYIGATFYDKNGKKIKSIRKYVKYPDYYTSDVSGKEFKPYTKKMPGYGDAIDIDEVTKKINGEPKGYKYINNTRYCYKDLTKNFDNYTVGDGRGGYGYVGYYMEDETNNKYDWITAKNGVTLYYVTSTSGDLRNVPTPNPSKPETYDGVIKAGQTGAFSPTFCKERGLRYLAIKIVGYKNGKPVMYYSEHIGLDAGIIGTSVAIK